MMDGFFEWVTSSKAQNLGSFIVGASALFGISFGMLEIIFWRRKKYEERRAETAATILSHLSDVLLDLEDLLKHAHRIQSESWKKEWDQVYDQFKKAKARSILLGDREIYVLFDKLHRKIRLVPQIKTIEESKILLEDCNPLFEELEMLLLEIAYLGIGKNIKVTQ